MSTKEYHMQDKLNELKARLLEVNDLQSNWPR